MSDCFNNKYTIGSIFFHPGTWWILEYKGEISSFLLVDSKYSIWNVCTPSNKRKRGLQLFFSEKLYMSILEILDLQLLKKKGFEVD